jgi:hypothetical protein
VTQRSSAQNSAFVAGRSGLQRSRTMNLEEVIPELRVDDARRATRWYSCLGIALDSEHATALAAF